MIAVEPQKAIGRVTFATEPLAKWFFDARPLFPLHYEELAMNQDAIKLDLDASRYEELEEKGALHIATVRDNGELVGYFVSFLMPHLHYASAGTMAYTDMYWLKPRYRTGYGAKLLLYVEHCWRQLGCTKAYLSCKVKQDHTAMFKLLGFELSDFFFVKLLR